jgi:hypothetical protein
LPIPSVGPKEVSSEVDIMYPALMDSHHRPAQASIIRDGDPIVRGGRETIQGRPAVSRLVILESSIFSALMNNISRPNRSRLWRCGIGKGWRIAEWAPC